MNAYAAVALFLCIISCCYLSLCARYLFTGTMPEFLS